MKKNLFIGLIALLLTTSLTLIFFKVEIAQFVGTDLMQVIDVGEMKVSNLSIPTNEVKILAFGDVSFDRYIRKRIEEEGKGAALAGMESLRDKLDEVDLVFVNLEGPVTENRIATGKEIAFQFDPDSLTILNDFSVDIALIANNHTYDMGKAAEEDTRRFLEEYGIIPVGNAKVVNEQSSYETVINGKSVAFAAFNHTDYRLNFEAAAALIAELKARNDIVIVSIHWGREYFTVPSDFQRERAREFIEAGADVIIGHHPHVIEGMEFIDGKPVFYSLGNFVFDQWFMEETQEGLGIELIFNYASTQINLIPFKIDKGFPRIATEAEGKEILQKFYEYSFSTNSDIENHQDLFHGS